MICWALESDGHEVAQAHTGEDGVAAARAALPDLVLLDLMLPGIGGIEVVRLLRAQPATARTPIILMSALHDAADNARRAGLRDCLRKPFDLAHLLATVDGALPSVATL